MTSRVLIVEDEAITALDLATELRGLGYDVCGIVDTVEDAVTAAAQERPQVVLMDVRLAAGGDGIEAARQVGLRQDASIIFLTAHSDEATLARALEVSPAGYLIKPFRGRELKVAIDVALAKQASEAAVRNLAMLDPLTGLPNRRRMDHVLRAEWAGCVRDGTPVCLLAIDVDCFKAFNDTYGHPAGDRCLQAVAGALRGCGRPGDTVCRWGGEEFLAVLPGADLTTATRIAEAMVQAVRDLGISHRSSGVASVVTVSVGVADLPPRGTPPVAVIVARADAALYAAKRAGRNRYAAMDGGPEPLVELLAPGFHSARAVPLFDHERMSGFLEFASRVPVAFGPDADGRLAAFVKLAALLMCRESVGLAATTAPAEAGDESARLHESGHLDHLQRVAHFSRLIARRLAGSHGLTDDFVEQVFLFAPLHDVGKAGISADILLKPGRLSPHERTVMASHVTIGMQIVETLIARFELGDLAGIDVLRNIVAGHHEKLDGSGYPLGLGGDAIPLESRIVAVADIFDALTSHRAYKEAWPAASAFAALEALAADGKLDPACVTALCTCQDECREIMDRFHMGRGGDYD
jgi:diguanylate cyclase (GGDEF)-like protein